MPSRNIIRVDVAESFYHVYARGVNKQEIFHDDEDFRVFLNLLRRYLHPEAQCDTKGVPYPNFYDNLELNCYCLMSNHFHLLVYQSEVGVLVRLMRGVMTSYSRYYNKKYKRSGPLFESRYKSSRISADAYLQHISRYIHLNPRDWAGYSYSSLPYFRGDYDTEWVRPNRVLRLFENREAYLSFVADYESQRALLNELKYELADT